MLRKKVYYNLEEEKLKCDDKNQVKNKERIKKNREKSACGPVHLAPST